MLKDVLSVAEGRNRLRLHNRPLGDSNPVFAVTGRAKAFC